MRSFLSFRNSRTDGSWSFAFKFPSAVAAGEIVYLVSSRKCLTKSGAASLAPISPRMSMACWLPRPFKAAISLGIADAGFNSARNALAALATQRGVSFSGSRARSTTLSAISDAPSEPRASIAAQRRNSSRASLAYSTNFGFRSEAPITPRASIASCSTLASFAFESRSLSTSDRGTLTHLSSRRRSRAKALTKSLESWNAARAPLTCQSFGVPSVALMHFGELRNNIERQAKQMQIRHVRAIIAGL